jgi:hypothetical protein
MSSVMITTMFGGDAWATTLLGTTNTIAATAMTDMRALVTPSPSARPLPYRRQRMGSFYHRWTGSGSDLGAGSGPGTATSPRHRMTPGWAGPWALG